jgi:cytochrome P450
MRMDMINADSLSDTVGVEPYEFYDASLAQCPVSWDDKLGAWIIYDRGTVRALMRRDIDQVRNPEGDVTVAGGPRALKYLKGEDQRRVHRWFVRTLSGPYLENLRASTIRPIVDDAMDTFVSSGRADLAMDFAEKIPIRVISAAMGLPWRDQAWIAAAKAKMNDLGAFFTARLILTEDLTILAQRASADLNEMLMPFIESRRDGTGDDMISQLWRAGSELLPDWSIDDVLAQARTAMQAATDTTTHNICNMMYLLMNLPPETRERLQAGEGASRANFIEESLRLYGAIHFRVRKANEDFELVESVTVRKDESLVPVIAAANRDESHYKCPHELDLDRSAPRDHLAFSFGPRTCAGAALARVELQDVLAAVLERIPDIHLDPSAQAPELQGFTVRSFRPLNVLFTPSPPR